MSLDLHDISSFHYVQLSECPVCSQKFLVNQALRIHVTRNHPEYELPPPGTVMNKSALKRIQEIKEKYGTDNVTVAMLGTNRGNRRNPVPTNAVGPR